MFSVRHYKKALYALPVIGFVVASLIYVGALFSNGLSRSMPEPVANGGFKPIGHDAPQNAVAQRRGVDQYGVLRASLERRDAKCARPITYHFGASRFDAQTVSTMLGFLRDEILPGARNTPGMDIHAFFVSSDGVIPKQISGFQQLESSIPGGIGVITQTPAGMTFTPGREQSAKFWLAIMSTELSQPDATGMFGIVIEPPLGGCGAIK